MCPKAVLVVLCLLVISACDDDSCPPGPGNIVFGRSKWIAEADYFPLAVGNTWTYRYHHYFNAGAAIPTETTYSGTAKLEVLSVTCDAGTRRATLHEQVQVTRRHVTRLEIPDTSYSQIDDARTVNLEQDAEGKISHPFLSGQLVRYHAASAETVRVTVSGKVKSLGRSICSARTDVSLVRDLGLQSMRYFCEDPSVAVEEGGSRSLIQADVKASSW